MPFFSIATIVAIHLVVLSTIHCYFYSSHSIKILSRSRLFAASVIATTVLQLTFAAFQYKEVGDVMLFAGAGWHLRHRIDFYFYDSLHTQYPFFPFLIFLHAGLNAAQEILPYVTFSWLLKFPLSIGLLGISALLLSEFKDSTHSRRSVLQFLTNPVTTLVIFFHGQVDVLLLLFLLLAFQVQRKARLDFLPHLFSVFLFAASIAAKTWSMLVLPYFVLLQTWRWRVATPIILLVLLIGNIFVYTRIVDGSSVRTVLPAIVAAGGPIGEWGVSFVVQNTELWEHYGLYVLLGAVGVVSLWLHFKQVARWDALFAVVATLLVTTPRWGIQYLFWLLPFVYLNTTLRFNQRLAIVCTTSCFATLNYLNIARQIEQLPVLFPEFVVRLVGSVCWITIVVVLVQVMRRQQYAKK